VPEFPDIVRYAEYRFFLRDLFACMKSRDRRFSHRMICAKCRARSSGWFADILAGRQRLKPMQLGGLAAAFKMDKRTQDFLAVLVDLERAEDPGSRAAAMERWLALKGPRHERVERDRFAFFDHWYHLALREVLSFAPFDGDYAALGAALQPPISEREAREAVALLERLGLILPRPFHRLAELPVLVKTPDGEARHWRHILADLMRLAPRALEEYGKQERDFSALTLSLSPAGLGQAGEAIADLRRKLLMIAEKDRGQNRVYQALFQVFPLSRTLGSADG
jgi:uncharacterized protein (TIGR02147 family)